MQSPIYLRPAIPQAVRRRSIYEGAETGIQEDRAVTDAAKTSQQLCIHLDGKNRLVGLFDLGNDGLASDISL